MPWPGLRSYPWMQLQIFKPSAVKTIWPLFNLLSVLLVLGVNYASQMQLWDAPTIGEISNEVDPLITPANYAFAIWGPIFLALLAFSGYAIYRALRYSEGNDYIRLASPWFVLANACNAAWVYAFTMQWFGLSVILMLLLLLSLVQIIRKLNMERWDAPIGTIAFVWWPICLYSGWIAVATLVNISFYLKWVGWEGGPLGAVGWSFVLILLAALLNAYLLFSRNMREFALVGVWALVAIGIRHQGSEALLTTTAWGCAVILLGMVAWHGYRNRATNPFLKLQQRIKH